MSIFDAIISNNKNEFLNFLNMMNEKDESSGFTPMHYCAQYGNIEFAKILINNGAQIDIKDNYGNTPLFKAVYFSKGKIEMIKLLITAGANADIKNNYGVSPKDLANSIGSFDVTECFK